MNLSDYMPTAEEALDLKTLAIENIIFYSLLVVGLIIYMIVGPGHEWIIEMAALPGACAFVFNFSTFAFQKGNELADAMGLPR